LALANVKEKQCITLRENGGEENEKGFLPLDFLSRRPSPFFIFSFPPHLPSLLFPLSLFSFSFVSPPSRRGLGTFTVPPRRRRAASRSPSPSQGAAAAQAAAADEEERKQPDNAADDAIVAVEDDEDNNTIIDNTTNDHHQSSPQQQPPASRRRRTSGGSVQPMQPDNNEDGAAEPMEGKAKREFFLFLFHFFDAISNASRFSSFASTALPRFTLSLIAERPGVCP
jgi:hypothetical protein